MKIILSRKGFDSGNAGMPSPIMPDGKPLSLPIPRRRGHYCSYNDLQFRRQSLSSIIKDLADGPIKFSDTAHVDPDLDEDRLPRKVGWRPIFGQTGGDQTHLENNGVGIGDLFLFFGWFRHTTKNSYRRLQYVKPHDDFHAFFGWLQVGEVHRVNKRSARTLPNWAQQHPHVATPDSFDLNNTIYISSKDLCLNGIDLNIPGGGSFPCISPSLRLTVHGGPRSLWALPDWFYPENDKPALSYHGDLSRWSIRGDKAILKSVARGQEFVFDTIYYPQAIPWVLSLFKEYRKS